MKQRLLVFLKYYLFWIVFFVLQKPIFMLWQYKLLGEVSVWDWVLVPLHGLPLDISVASYITALAGVLLCVSCWVEWEKTERILNIATGVLLFVALWTMLGDNGCFPSWGYHLNKDVFSYLASPQEALACAPWWVWTLGVVAFVGLFMVCGRVYLWWMKGGRTASLSEIRPLSCQIIDTLVLLLLTGALFLPMRGSVTASTMNTGRVYFSDNRMLNLAAINPVFNILETVSEDHFSKDRYRYMDSEKAAALTESWLAPKEKYELKDSLFTTQRPDIVLIILESFSKNAMKAGAMPQLSRLMEEGINFDNTYAASYRTDRGVMAVLGAFPGCATSSLMMVPSKSGKLPQIGQVLKKEGYQLKFYYGGDEDFTNMRSYLITGGFENRVADRDFALSEQTSKWGVPDHVVFRRAAEEIVHHEDSVPYFDVILSLSSHEPFDVPYHHFDHEYLNAIAYTDSCLGALIDTLRLSPKWYSTLVVMVADHGYPYPDGIACYDTLHYQIPMVIAGGAVRAPRWISQRCQQVDWVPTLLHQMGLDASSFRFAKDVMDERIRPWAYYHFWDGFALLTDSACTVVDAEVDQVIMGEKNEQLVGSAKAITQTIMETIYQL